MHPQQVCRSAFFQRDLNRLEKWANSNLVKFSQGKCKVLHQGRDSSSQYQLKSRFAESDLGVLVNKQLTLSQQRTLVAKKANGIVGCIKNISSMLRGMILPFCSALERHLCSTGFNAGLPSTKETWSYWNEFIEGSQ